MRYTEGTDACYEGVRSQNPQWIWSVSPASHILGYLDPLVHGMRCVQCTHWLVEHPQESIPIYTRDPDYHEIFSYGQLVSVIWSFRHVRARILRDFSCFGSCFEADPWGLRKSWKNRLRPTVVAAAVARRHGALLMTRSSHGNRELVYGFGPVGRGLRVEGWG